MRPAPRPRARSATPPCSASRTWPPAGTSRCRSWPTRTAPSGRSASASARSSAGTRRSSRRRRHRWSTASTACASELFEAAARRRPRRRLHRRRHRRVHRRRAGPVLLPRDEHPPAGRAPGHRVHDRPRPRRAAARRRRRAAPRPVAAGRRTGTRSRCACTPRTRPPTGSRSRARCTASTCPASTVEFGVGARTRRAAPRLRAWSTASVVGVHYDPMLAKVDLLGADPRPGRPHAGRRAGAGTRSTAWSPTATCWSACCATPRSSPATPTPRSSTGTASTRWPRRSRATDAVRLCALAAALAARRRRTERGPRCCARCRRAGATCASQPQRDRFDERRGRLPAHPRRRRGRRVRRRRRWCSAAPDAGACSTCGGVRRAFDVAAAPRRRVRRLAARRRCGSHRVAALRRPGRAGRGRLAARADAGHRRAARGRRRATPVAAGQPILWLEAMKMQHRIDAPADGVVAELPVAAGQQIDVGAVLAVVGDDGGGSSGFHVRPRNRSRCARRWPSWAGVTATSTPRRGARAARAADRAVGRGRAGAASWASTCPRSTAAAAPGCTSSRWCARSSTPPAAGC